MVSQNLDDVRALLEVEPIGSSVFRGRVEDPGWGRAYGGLVFAQPLAAAMRTVPSDRVVRSTETTFVRAVMVDAPLEHEVEALADGRKTSTRRVTTRQGTKIVATSTTSFHVPRPGLEHQRVMPIVAPPSALRSEADVTLPFRDLVPASRRAHLVTSHAFEHRVASPLDHPVHPSTMAPRRHVWVRGRGKAPNSDAWSALLMAYASDYFCFPTALLPHGVTWMTPGYRVLTLRHAMYFHAPLRVDDWFLHELDSPRTVGERGLVLGDVFSRAGVLVANTVQEGIVDFEEPSPHTGER